MKHYENYNLPGKYYASADGSIYDSNENELDYIINDNIKYANIDNTLIPVSNIIWNMFIGEYIGDIQYIDDNYLNCSIKNLTVDINIIIDKSDLKEI